VVHLCGNKGAFAAITEDGSVISWGDVVLFGGNLLLGQFFLHQRVCQILGTETGFVVLTELGRVFSWVCHRVPTVLTFDGFDISGVVLLYSSRAGLLCVQDDCRLLCVQQMWDTCQAKHYGPISGVRRVASTADAYAVIAADGSVLAFGENRYGGDPFGLEHVRGDPCL
jgi:alpha-tubulin suppressor-like RCC1 family protein